MIWLAKSTMLTHALGPTCFPSNCWASFDSRSCILGIPVNPVKPQGVILGVPPPRWTSHQLSDESVWSPSPWDRKWPFWEAAKLSKSRRSMGLRPGRLPSRWTTAGRNRRGALCLGGFVSFPNTLLLSSFSEGACPEGRPLGACPHHVLMEENRLLTPFQMEGNHS